jgi:hypothetical protein
MRLTREEKQLMHSGRKIQAIKSVYVRMQPRDLRAAKQAADKYQRTLRYRFWKRRTDSACSLAGVPGCYGELRAAYDQAQAQFGVGDRYATFNKQTVEAWGRAIAKAQGGA